MCPSPALACHACLRASASCSSGGSIHENLICIASQTLFYLGDRGATDQRKIVNLNRMKDMRCVAAVTVYFHSRSVSETQGGSPAKLRPVGQGLAGRHSVIIYCIRYFVLFCLNISSGNGLFPSVLVRDMKHLQ